MCFSRPNVRIFDLKSEDAYKRWRDNKLENYPVSINEMMIELSNFDCPSETEITALKNCISKTNMVLYVSSHEQTLDIKKIKSALRSLGEKIGLKNLDSNLCADEDDISTLSTRNNGSRGRYIPYTNKPINWHTDGYYNALDRKIKGMVLHCVSPAAKGGESALMDPEMAYILLRDENPDYIDALMRVDVMKIPANIENNNIIREAQNGPVFSLCDEKKYLHMRYTGRSHSVKWKNDRTATAAVEFLSEVLKSDSPYIHKHVFSGGEGVLSNNVLHKRAGFEDDTQRQRIFLRARYLDRIVI